MKVLVMGVTGFIGGRIANHLMNKGCFVIERGRSKIKEGKLDSRIKYSQGDLTDPVYCSQLTKEIDLVVHCAGKADTWGNYEDFYNANVVATKHLLEVSKENGVKKFINISSPSIYFNFQDHFNIDESFIY